MKFKHLPINSKFKFSNPVEFSIGRTFRKTSARGYQEIDKTIKYKVGTINVEVMEIVFA
jgi:hypothetical protein